MFRLFFVLVFSFISLFFIHQLFYPLYQSTSIIIDYGFNSFDLCTKDPNLWKTIKFLFIILHIFSSLIVSNTLFSIISNNFKKQSNHKANIFLAKKKQIIQDSSCLNLFIGNDLYGNSITIPEKGLFQNILITGTIGTGKTSSAMYPITEQLIAYNSSISSSKLGMLILDVKGNYYKQVLEYSKKFHRQDDVIVIELNGKNTYNPLDKPNLKPSVLANQLKNILLLFSPNNSESYWLDKAESTISEAIKLCRIYNDNYVTFEELHNIITSKDYYNEKIEYSRNLFLNQNLKHSQQYDLLTSITYFEREFFSLDSRTLNILKSEITRITNCFVNDLDIKSTFCPSKKSLTFNGFYDVLHLGKIVVLNMNINEYKNLSKIIAAYLKIDFQTEVMTRLSKESSHDLRKVAFISDEYSEYVTSSDSNFFSQSREANCINIVATQSYTSILNTLNNQYSTKVIIQNLVNKLWFRSDDLFTIESAQKQLGKTEKEKTSKTISENAKQTFYSYINNSLTSKDSNISESINTYHQTDYTYDTKFFTQSLQSFNCLGFLSTGNQILPPCQIQMIPYFKERNEIK